MKTGISFVSAAFTAALFLTLPSAVAKAGDEWMEYKNPYVNEQGNLANPNRTTDEILALGRDFSTDALTFTPDQMDKPADGQKNKLENMRGHFSDSAWTEYMQYMRDSRFLDMVFRNRYTASTIADGDIIIVNSGPIAGSYRWVIQVPLLITFHQISRVGEVMPVTSGRFTLTLQIGRVKADEGKDGMQIDSWKMSQDQSGR
jgi:hypothetical protein